MDTTPPDQRVSVPAGLDQLALEIAELIHSVASPDLLNPAAFIDDYINTAVKGSTMPEEHKALFTSATMIEVAYRERAKSQGLLGTGSPPKVKTARYPLNQIITDYFRHDIKEAAEVRIRWPNAFPEDLRRVFDTVDLQATYKKQVDAYFSQPNIEQLSILIMQQDLDKTIRRYLQTHPASVVHDTLGKGYLQGRIKPQLVAFHGETIMTLARAVFLPAPEGNDVPDGLLVFLDEKDGQSVYEIPQDPARRRHLIENDPDLRDKVLARIPLYDRLKPGNETLRYRRSVIGLYPNIIWKSSLKFRASIDPGHDLFELNRQRLLGDIDTLVSTDSERLNDKLLEFAGHAMVGLSLGVALPLGVGLLPARIAVGFLLGLGNAATDAARGALADLPEEAAALYRAAAIAVAFEVVGPLAQRLAGRTLSAMSKSKLALKVEALLSTSKGAAAKPPHVVASLQRTNTAAKLRNLELILDTKLKKGPQAAQLWVDSRGHFLERHIAPYDVTVYRGMVFRGDLRHPDIVFKQGFKLRTPAAEIQKDIHQVTGVRGGFGGGHDALDLDGRGISTSVFYDNHHVGAYTYGGAKGGHTYLIDARKFDGYHLYANDYAARHPSGPPIRFSPVEINYANDLPPSAIIGAYDKDGTFITNINGMRKTARSDQAKIERQLARRALRRVVAAEAVEKSAVAWLPIQ
jgi:hypothetical protein